MEEKYIKGFLEYIYIYTCNGNCKDFGSDRSELRVGVMLVRGGTLRKRVKA